MAATLAPAGFGAYRVPADPAAAAARAGVSLSLLPPQSAAPDSNGGSGGSSAAAAAPPTADGWRSPRKRNPNGSAGGRLSTPASPVAKPSPSASLNSVAAQESAVLSAAAAVAGAYAYSLTPHQPRVTTFPGPVVALANNLLSALRHDAFTLVRAPLDSNTNNLNASIAKIAAAAADPVPAPPDFALSLLECSVSLWTASASAAAAAAAAAEDSALLSCSRLHWDLRTVASIPVTRARLLASVPSGAAVGVAAATAAAAASALLAGPAAPALRYYSGVDRDLNPLLGDAVVAAAATYGVADELRAHTLRRRAARSASASASARTGGPTGGSGGSAVPASVAWGSTFSRRSPPQLLTVPIGALALLRSLRALSGGRCMLLAVDKLAQPATPVLAHDTRAPPAASAASLVTTGAAAGPGADAGVAPLLLPGRRAPAVVIAGGQPSVVLNAAALRAYAHGTGGACLVSAADAAGAPTGAGVVAVVYNDASPAAALAAADADADDAGLDGGSGSNAALLLRRAAHMADLRAPALPPLQGAPLAPGLAVLPPAVAAAATAAAALAAGDAAAAGAGDVGVDAEAIATLATLALAAAAPATPALAATFDALAADAEASALPLPLPAHLALPLLPHEPVPPCPLLAFPPRLAAGCGPAAGANAPALLRLRRWGLRAAAAAALGPLSAAPRHARFLALAAEALARGVGSDLPPQQPLGSTLAVGSGHGSGSASASASAGAEASLRLLWDAVALLREADCDPLLLAALSDCLVHHVARLVRAATAAGGDAAPAGSGAGAQQKGQQGQGRARGGSVSAVSSGAGAASLPAPLRACWAALQDCLLRAVARDYPLPQGADVSFAAGQTLLAMRAYPCAVSCFALSVVRHGEHCATAHNMGLCMLFMEKPVAALAWFDEALALEPALTEARRWRRAVLKRIEADERKRSYMAAQNARNRA